MPTGAYRRAGVDLEAAAEATRLIADLAREASRDEVVEGVGGFAGLYRIGGGRLLAAATDGVGTKLEIATMAGRFDTVGIDLVAMCANDVVCTGAEPVFFLDYLAVGRLVPEHAAAVVAGVAEGCRRAGCALLGGETAEHPGVLEEGRFDLAGFCVGVVPEERMLGPQRVGLGDALLGLPSSGLHSNGFSLVRRALEETETDVFSTPKELTRPLVEELLEPTLIYVPAVLALSERGLVHSAAHITGGGIPENLPRALPEGLGAVVDRGSWEPPPVFSLVERISQASSSDLLRTLNMGMGMILVVPADAVPEARSVAEEHGHVAVPLGRVEEASEVRFT
ncbi:MAG: phosphoribosylformylglycinamidine cyclo-ligase [Actinomycetota bacterium]|nr:phosphoribosylformylglycinamidine cyclo-ligase [Actinomycetota bacterium]